MRDPLLFTTAMNSHHNVIFKIEKVFQKTLFIAIQTFLFFYLSFICTFSIKANAAESEVNDIFKSAVHIPDGAVISGLDYLIIADHEDVPKSSYDPNVFIVDETPFIITPHLDFKNTIVISTVLHDVAVHLCNNNTFDYQLQAAFPLAKKQDLRSKRSLASIKNNAPTNNPFSWCPFSDFGSLIISQTKVNVCHYHAITTIKLFSSKQFFQTNASQKVASTKSACHSFLLVYSFTSRPPPTSHQTPKLDF